MIRRSELSVVSPPWSVEALVWLVAVLTFGVGDIVTTSLGLGLDGVREMGPLAEPLIRQYGLGVMIPMKLATFGGGFFLWKYAPQPHSVGVPLGLAVLGISVTVWNLRVMTLALFT